MSQILGTSKDILQLHTLDENREIALELAQQAKRQLIIFTQELDAPVYDNENFERAVFELVKRHPGTQIRILIQDASCAIHDGHRLLRLAQHLSSSLQMRKPAHEQRDQQSAFLIADGVGYLHRVVGNQYNYTATACFMAPLLSRQLSDYFDRTWEHADEDPQLRRLYV